MEGETEVNAHVPQGKVTRALRSVIAERRRQIKGEKWTPEHDDRHCTGHIADAAACYALGAEHVYRIYNGRQVVPCWPSDWLFKPKDRRRDLVRAAALLLAEIERLDRRTRRGK
jgi:hypothetical protein